MKFKEYSPLILRTGIAIVFLWFGFTQISNPEGWVKMVPSYLGTPTTNLIYINGVVEIILAALLLLGLFTRTVALLLTLHLLHIITILGYGPSAARDFALAVATFSIFLKGPDEFCFDNLKKKPTNPV